MHDFPPAATSARSPRRSLTVAALSLLFASVCFTEALPAFEPQESKGPKALDRRVSFETAKLALERGDPAVGARLLEELSASAATDAERRLLRLLATRSRPASPDQATPIELDTLLGGSDLDRAPAWVEAELLALASELRLEQLQRDAKAQLKAVLEEHRRALGGLEHLAALRSFVATGTLEVSGAELPFRLIRSRRGLYRFDIATPAGIRIDAADPQAAWRSDPRIDDGRPAYLSGDEGRALRRNAELLGPLLRPEAEGRLAYRGLETIGGREQHAIDVVGVVDGPGGAGGAAVDQRIYVDAETHLETRVVDLDATGEPRLEVETELRAVDGYLLPARQTVRSGAATSVFRFEEYRVNVPLDLELFDAGSVEPAIPVGIAPGSEAPTSDDTGDRP